MISFKIGNENRPVVESRKFRESIFARQYRTALNIADVYFRNLPSEHDTGLDNTAFQGIAFCGERGEGKTSAMLSVINILKDANKYAHYRNAYTDEENEGVRFIKDVLGPDTPLLRLRTSILKLIDPTRFANYNILEVILTELYDNVNRKKKQDKESGRSYSSPNDIYLLFQKVKRSIEMLIKPEDKLFDTLEDLEDLSAVINLQDNFKKLIQEYLNLHNTKLLIIPIDDMDLKISGTFELTERLRKYLAMPEVVVLMSVKPEQLLSSVKHALRNSVGNDEASFNENEINRMAEKYITKLLPQGCRVDMGMEVTIFDQPFEVYDHNDKPIYRGDTLKDGILELIFIKTRYLFYNSLGEISTLFPSNLRELVHLIGMVVEMRDIKENGCPIHRANQQQFKNYFFTVWTECLDSKDREKALEWSSSTTDYTLNKEVVMYLKSKLPQYIERTDSLYSAEEYDLETHLKRLENSDSIIRDSILNPRNYTYNISIGDVFFILAGIEKEVLPDKDYKLIFFIRSLYSIKMYDKYDYITHNHLMFPPGANSGGIYRNDERFNHVNTLQRLVGGSYFTFAPRDLISELPPIDRRVISGRNGLNQLINKMGKEKDENENGLTPIQEMRMAEFFVLTTSHIITSKNDMAKEGNIYPVVYMNEARGESNPIAFSEFSGLRGYYEFNILSPFANLVNIRYAYYRFDKGEDLFKMALVNPESLLCDIWRNAWQNRGGMNMDWDEYYGEVMNKYQAADEKSQLDIIEKEFEPLASVAIIRNAEVLVAMSDHFRRIREEVSRHGVDLKLKKLIKSLPNEEKNRYIILDKLSLFYDKIADSEMAMSTHRFRMVTAKEGIRHNISFSFCRILSDFLKSIIDNYNEDIDNYNEDMDEDKEKKKNEYLERFFEIFDWKATQIKKEDKEANVTNKVDIKKHSSNESEEKSVPKSKRYVELKANMRMLFKEIQFRSNEKRSFNDIFGWLIFPEHTEDPIVLECIKVKNSLHKHFTNYPYTDSVVRSSWLERIDITPTLWYDLFSNDYYQDLFKKIFNTLDLTIVLGPRPKEPGQPK